MPAQEVNAQWLTAILDTIDEGIHAVDMNGVTIFYNGAAARMDGLAPADVIGRHVLSVFPSLGQDSSTLLQVLRGGQALRDRAQTYTNYLGVKVHTVNTTLPIRVGGQVVGALEIAKDLTQVRNLSEQVLTLQAQVVGGGRKRRDAKPTAPAATYTFSDMLTHDERLGEVKRRAEQAAQTSSPILVYGETGTGKELLVQAIHNAGSRRQQPFLAVNCAALPGSLLEGILFGTVRGSFTGAQDRPGMFELADGGTLFLDEIQSMPLELQAKLLRVLQEGEVMRVGDTHVRHLDVRVVAAMNQPPESAVEAGDIRRDLYYRINVVRLDIPPLRERVTDIPYLTSRFIDKWNRRFHSQVTGVTPAVECLFAHYPWPGNVRELENAIEAAMNLVNVGTIDLDTLPTHLRERAYSGEHSDTQPEGSLGVRRTTEVTLGRGDSDSLEARARRLTTDAQDTADRDWVTQLAESGMDTFWNTLTIASPPQHTMTWPALQAAFERLVLSQALAQSHRNVSKAAARLGLPRQTLQYRMQQLGL